MTGKKSNTKAKFKLRSIFLFVNLTVLFLPLFGVIFFRFYENQLVKQTELELISQAAVLASTYKHDLKDIGNINNFYGIEVMRSAKIDEFYTPVAPQASLSTNEVLPPRPDGIEPERQTQLAEVSKQKPMAPTPAPQIETGSQEKARRGPLQSDDTITVIGSRVSGRTALQSNVPVDVIQVSEIAKRVGDSLTPIIIDAQKTTLSGIKILDYEGTVVAGRNELGYNFAHLPEIKKALAGEYNSLLRERITDDPVPALASISRGTGIRLFVAYPIIENEMLWGVVYLSRTPQNILKHLYANKDKVILIGLSLLTVTLLLALLTSYTISKPINRLVGRIKRFTEGEVGAIEPMPSPGVKEIELLSKSFSKMAHSINDRALYIRTFALSVSHEFKTPITSIQGSAELLLEHLDDMESEKKQKFLSNIIADSDRLKRLINRLLELAKADNYIPNQEKSSLNNVLGFLKQRYIDYNLKIEYQNSDDKHVLIAQEHLETIFNNLFENALQHGATEVTLKTTEHYGFITIKLSDNGEGVSDANKDKIFNSFFTTKRENGGTGLGLGIVLSLLNSHNGSIILLEDNENTTFELTLPIATKTQ